MKGRMRLVRKLFVSCATPSSNRRRGERVVPLGGGFSPGKAAHRRILGLPCYYHATELAISRVCAAIGAFCRARPGGIALTSSRC